MSEAYFYITIADGTFQAGMARRDALLHHRKEFRTQCAPRSRWLRSTIEWTPKCGAGVKNTRLSCRSVSSVIRCSHANVLNENWARKRAAVSNTETRLLTVSEDGNSARYLKKKYAFIMKTDSTEPRSPWNRDIRIWPTYNYWNCASCTLSHSYKQKR